MVWLEKAGYVQAAIVSVRIENVLRGVLTPSSIMQEIEPQIFISYSSKDDRTAGLLCSTLESQGFNCWIAPRDILSGTDWSAAIIDGISRCKIMVLVFSGYSNESPQVRREVERAVNKGLVIVPFRIENIPMGKSLEYFLSTSHWLDATTLPLDPHIERLSQSIHSLLRVPGSTLAQARNVPATSAPKPRKVRLRVIAGVSFALLMIVLLAVLWPRRDPQETPTSPPQPATWTFQDEKTVFGIIAVDLNRLPLAARSRRRYFTLTHLANRARSAKVPSVAEARDAMRDLVAAKQISQSSTLVVKPIDEFETIYAIDLPVLGWESTDHWKAIQVGYPYGLKSTGQREYEAVRELTGDDLPYVRGDWFVAAAIEPRLFQKLFIGAHDRPSSTAIEAVIRRYRGDLGAADAAAELGLPTTEEFLARVRADEKLRTAGLEPFLEDRRIPRDEWVAVRGVSSLFQKAARALGLGEPFIQRPD